MCERMFESEVVESGGEILCSQMKSGAYIFTPCFCCVKPETYLSSALQIEFVNQF